jgi:RNA polymerase sigma-70 factor (ECF subfamily)
METNRMHDETSNTWLHSIKGAEPGASGWCHLVDSYGPFVRNILTRKGLQDACADDVGQNVMAVVIRKLPEFDRQRTGSFRSWLRRITVNCLRDYVKSSQYRRRASGNDDSHQLIELLEDANSDFTHMWNREHAHHVLNELLKAVAQDFAPSSIEAFRRLALNDESVDDVARDLGMTTNACFIARSRILKRLRELLRELFGDDEGLLELMG